MPNAQDPKRTPIATWAEVVPGFRSPQEYVAAGFAHQMTAGAVRTAATRYVALLELALPEDVVLKDSTFTGPAHDVDRLRPLVREHVTALNQSLAAVNDRPLFDNVAFRAATKDASFFEL